MIIYTKRNFLIFSLAPKSDHKYAGVHVTHKGTEITNGHYAISVSVPKDNNGAAEFPKSKLHKPLKRKRIDTVISKESAQDIVKIITGSSGNYTFDFRDLVVVGRGSDGDNTIFLAADYDGTKAVCASNLDMEFPDFKKIVKKRKARVKVAFNAEYMKRICDYFLKAKANKIVMSVVNEEFPIKLESEVDDQEIKVILAPVKID